MESLTIKNLFFSYDGKPLLKNISLSLKKGEFLSIVGSSGCGKSTIIKLVAGIEKADSGTIKSESTGYMPQKDLLLPWRTVLDNILLPVEISKQNLKVEKEKALEYLKKLKLDEYQNSFPNELSGGMRQRVSFLRTLFTQGEILLLDEPFSALDMITKEQLQKWLLEILNDFKKSVIFITHDINEAIFLSDRILVCKNSPLDSFEEFKISSQIKNSPEEIIALKEKILKIIKGGEL
jgi:putative hydroxymethylpyrimidine transport system ATP-binding protein